MRMHRKVMNLYSCKPDSKIRLVPKLFAPNSLGSFFPLLTAPGPLCSNPYNGPEPLVEPLKALARVA